MSTSDSDSIDLQSGPSSPQSRWESQSESDLLMNSNYEMIQPEIEYEVDGTVSSVNSEDLDQDWEHFRSPSPRSPMIPQPLVSTHGSESSDNRSSVDGEEDHSKLFDLEHSTSSSFISRFTEDSHDGSDTTLDSLAATLCLPYTFPDPTHNPDPTDNKLSNPSPQAWPPTSHISPDAAPFQEHDSFTLYDQTASELQGSLYERSPTRSSYTTHVSHWPNLDQSDGPPSLTEKHSPELDILSNQPGLSSNPQAICTGRSSSMGPVTSPAPLSDSITAVYELHIYLLGKPMSRCEIRTFLNKFRTNFIAHASVDVSIPSEQSRNRPRCEEAMNRLSNQYRTVIARSLGSTSQPAHSQLMRQTSDLEIILHDFTRLSEERAQMHVVSLPARPALVVYRVDLSTFTMPRWLSPLLLSRRGGDDLMMLMLLSVVPSEPDLNTSVNISVDSDSVENSQSSERCIDDLESDHPDLFHQILRCTDSVRSSSSSIMDLRDVDRLSSPSIAQLRKLRMPIQSPKPTLLKSTILSISVLLFSAMLMTWFTLHSRQSVSPSISFSACQAHPIIHSLVPTLRSSCSIDSLSSMNDSVLPEPAQQVNSLRTDVMPILSKDVLPISEDPTLEATPEPSTKPKSESSLSKSFKPDTESKFPSGFGGPECSVGNSSSQCKDGTNGQAKSDKPGSSSFIFSFMSHHSNSFSNQSLFRVSYPRLSSLPKLVKQAVVSSGPNVMKRSRKLVHHSNLLNTLSETMTFDNTPDPLHSMLKPTKLWAHRLPKRLRQGLRNLQHRPDACLNVMMKASIPSSRALNQLPILGKEWVRRRNLFQQALGDLYPF